MNNTVQNNDIEQELNAIRIKLYEQTKNMTTDDRVAFLSQMAKDGLARHGIKVRYADAPIVRQQV